MRILIIGGTRFMGRAVASQMARKGHAVTCLSRSGPAKDEAPMPGVSHLKGDRREAGRLAAAVRDCRPEVVIDMMCMTQEDAEGLVAAADCPLVVASSCDVYRNFGGLTGFETGTPDPAPLSEEAPVRSKFYPYRDTTSEAKQNGWIQDYDKILVEKTVLGRGAIVLRLPMVFGPNDYQHRLFEYLRRMDDGRRAVLIGREEAGWVACRGYVDDMANGIQLAALHPEHGGQVFNLGYQMQLTEKEWIEAIGRAAGWTGRVVVVENADLPKHLQSPGDYRFEISVETHKARRVLGYREKHTLAEALERTVAWERVNGPDGAAPPDYAAEDEALGKAV